MFFVFHQHYVVMFFFFFHRMQTWLLVEMHNLNFKVYVVLFFFFFFVVFYELTFAELKKV